MKPELYIGLMSGTSVDAVDAALVDIRDTITVLASTELAYPAELQAQCLALFEPGSNEVERLGALSAQLSELYIKATDKLLKLSGHKSSDVIAIGNHGQTIRHRPNQQHAFSLQIGDNYRLANQTGIAVIGDFRSQDVALGGQGAPLTPAFHQFLAGDQHCAFINIGGIANITAIGQTLRGWDCGPGNALLDAWFRKHHPNSAVGYDKDGRWAQSSEASEALVNQLLKHSFFTREPPKSTGKEEFTLGWLNRELEAHCELTPARVQASLLELSARCIARDLNKLNCHVAYLCGGGIYNPALVSRLQQLCNAELKSSEELGVAPDCMEAAAFAWLAQRHVHKLPGNAPTVTGAKREAVLGCLYLPG
ncbi:anhydro-N-acetylmuramic acid kinase [Agaribacterium haliotis]|uniref:anhydro-N-acetylmuramic acid kinase n=1 Tax=Agaribacterium haliotis TaxID=2013869 RepID=UPI000BB575A7|nr:anhydro-N-acetylmuramic acid kinase [Agaribacterium haliotis]